MPGPRQTLTLRALAAAALLASSLSLAQGPARGQLPGGGDITVYRDRFGVPHVEAPSLQGLSYATGYLMAKDRLFEMDVIRKLGQGRLSELIGPSMLDADRYTRREFLLTADIEGTRADPVPLHLRNAVTGLMRGLGYGKGYRYAHDKPEHFDPEETFLPESLKGRRYYEPTDLGAEAALKKRVDDLRRSVTAAARARRGDTSGPTPGSG